MMDRKWSRAAWTAIGAAVLLLPGVALSAIVDGAFGAREQVSLPLVVSAVLVGTAALGLAAMALYRLRELLDERYGYHGIDGIVRFLIVAMVSIAALSMVGRLTVALTRAPGEATATVATLFVVPMVLLQIATGIVGIVAGVRLYALENDLQGLLRPYALLSIIGGACFATVILAPLALLLLVAQHVLLALTFLRAGETEPAVEFV